MTSRLRLLVILACLTGGTHAAGAADAPLEAQLRQALPEAVTLYRWLHAHPELSGRERATAARLARELETLGLEVHPEIGGHGLVAILRSGRNPRRRVVLLRADMDALPIVEATKLPYASTSRGVMHACGHDVHMSNALGTLRVLRALRGTWEGTVLFVAQPAEELGRGSRDMLAHPTFKRLVRKVGRPAVALALHVSGDLPAGDVSLCPGFTSANVDAVDIIVHGRGGHGARPHQTVDPVVIGSHIVVALQTIVSRRVKPGERAVITVGKFDAGTKHNIIPDRATLLVTVRSFGDQPRQQLLQEIRRVVVNVARAHHAPRDPTMRVKEGYVPSVYNDPAWTRRLHRVFAATLGEGHVRVGEPSTGGEDFGRFPRQLKVPGVMYRLGTAPRKRFDPTRPAALPQPHSPGYAPDATETLRTGLSTMTRAVLEALQ